MLRVRDWSSAVKPETYLASCSESAKDPYNAQALDFNNHVLGTFPANLLRHVALSLIHI